MPDNIRTRVRLESRCEEVLDAFLEHLKDAGGDLALVLYRSLFDANQSGSRGADRPNVERFVGLSAPLVMEQVIMMGANDLSYMAFEYAADRAHLAVTVAVAALHGLTVNIQTDDPEGEGRRHMEFELRRQF